MTAQTSTSIDPLSADEIKSPSGLGALLAGFYSRRSASIGSSRAALIAGYMPKNMPTRADKVKLTTSVQGSTIVSHFAK